MEECTKANEVVVQEHTSSQGNGKVEVSPSYSSRPIIEQQD